ncbi:MAG: hypothetical protein AB8G23_07750 [Myxococcota bacterium]
MRLISITLMALATQTGCMTLKADIPEDAMRHHLEHKEGIVLPALCSHEGNRFSEGALVCMEGRQMSCDPSSRWLAGEDC